MTPQIIDLGDGRELVITIRSKPDEKGATLGDFWQVAAPFSYEYFVSELIRNQVVDENLVWILREMRGNHFTASFHVRACFEVLYQFGCIPYMSAPQIQKVFNSTFQTNINCSKVIENKNKCRRESDYFCAMFGGFANADTNADSE